MDAQRRGRSPHPPPTPLNPSSPQSPTRPRRTTAPSESAGGTSGLSTFMHYASVLRRPFENPHQDICHHFNVEQTSVTLAPGHAPPQSVNMRVLRDAHMPAHALLVIDSSLNSSGPTIPHIYSPSEAPVIPVNADIFASKFTYDISQLVNELSVPGTPFPVPFWDHLTRTQAVTVPLVPLYVPHPPSIPLLLLFGLGLHHSISQSQASDNAHPNRSPKTSRFDHATTVTMGMLAPYLLPIPVIEEFPSAAAMVEAMARLCTKEELQQYFLHNQGLWRNVLVLGPKDGALVDMVRTAWNVTKEARRMQEQYGLGLGDVTGGGVDPTSESGRPI